MSEPARIWQKRSATAEVRVKRGSTEIIFAFARAFGFDRPLESARMVLCRITAHDEHHVVFFMSTQRWSCPRPNVGPKLETVGPW